MLPKLQSNHWMQCWKSSRHIFGNKSHIITALHESLKKEEEKEITSIWHNLAGFWWLPIQIRYNPDALWLGRTHEITTEEKLYAFPSYSSSHADHFPPTYAQTLRRYGFSCSFLFPIHLYFCMISSMLLFLLGSTPHADIQTHCKIVMSKTAYIISNSG